MTTTTTTADALRAAIDMISIERQSFADCNARPDGSISDADGLILRDYDEVLALIRDAIEAAESAKPEPARQPMTEREIIGGFELLPEALTFFTAFEAGVRHAERHHRIGSNSEETHVFRWERGMARQGAARHHHQRNRMSAECGSGKGGRDDPD